MAVSGTSDPTGVQGVGASFDQIWDLMWVDVGQVFAKAGTFDVGSKVAAMLCGLGVSIDLVVMAAVFIMARFLLAIVIVFGPVMIGTLLFETTKPIFEALGWKNGRADRFASCRHDHPDHAISRKSYFMSRSRSLKARPA